MTSSRSFEVEIRQSGSTSRVEVAGEGVAGGAIAFPSPLRTDRGAELTLRRIGDGEGDPCWLTLGAEVVVHVPPKESERSVHLLERTKDLYGIAVFELWVREEPFESHVPDHRILVDLESPPEVAALWKRLIRELEEAHRGLARDLLGRSFAEGTARNVRVFEPESECQRLAEHYEELSAALDQVGSQPSHTLEREWRWGRWRSGDRLDASVVRSMIRAGVGDPRGATATPVVRVLRPRLTTDLAEHRHLRAETLHLARRADQLAESCGRAAGLLKAEAREWDLGGRGRSIYEERYLPRIEQLESLGTRAVELGRSLRDLVDAHGYLRNAGEPRTPLAPTPIFIGRPGYRRAYECLVAARETTSALVDGEGLHIRLRDLDLLYEYWCYLAVIGTCRRILGPATSSDRVEVIDEVFRPDLRPGQSVQWRSGDRTTVRVFYEPAIPPTHGRPSELFPWRAALVGAPLRPDILVVVETEGELPRAMVLDAKNTTSFHWERLFQLSDYRSLVHDPATGAQPIRQTVLLHRTSIPPIGNVPGYVDGAPFDERATLILGIELLPERFDALEIVLRRFLRASAETRPPGERSLPRS